MKNKVGLVGSLEEARGLRMREKAILVGRREETRVLRK